ncbi:hypothetical protein [Streptomyces sp. NPDC101132]|uniref:hypothetical protein n=1 Tax=Streptomyces sp. NPDC101132 TaxID=3366110 RepID=UPI003802DDC4
MVSASRITWFAIAFTFALPSMLLMFREDGRITSGTWITSVLFAAAIATTATIFLGEAKQ